MLHFECDYACGAAQPVLDALVRTNGEQTSGYGEDPHCERARALIREQCRRADILISAVGRRGLITSDMVKPGAVVVDVAMNRNEEGKLCGDVDFAAVAEKAAYITPVPGGVGPMTRAMLMENTISASRRRQHKEG